jgi:hypothetical protein
MADAANAQKRLQDQALIAVFLVVERVYERDTPLPFSFFTAIYRPATLHERETTDGYSGQHKNSYRDFHVL